MTDEAVRRLIFALDVETFAEAQQWVGAEPRDEAERRPRDFLLPRVQAGHEPGHERQVALLLAEHDGRRVRLGGSQVAAVGGAGDLREPFRSAARRATGRTTRPRRAPAASVQE